MEGDTKNVEINEILLKIKNLQAKKNGATFQEASKKLGIEINELKLK